MRRRRYHLVFFKNCLVFGDWVKQPSLRVLGEIVGTRVHWKVVTTGSRSTISNKIDVHLYRR